MVSQTALDEFTERFHIFGSVKSQIEVLDNFLESFKIIHKNLNKEIRQQHKIKKVAVKPVEEKSAVIPNKRGRKKKIIEDTRSEEEKLMDEIISRAQLEKRKFRCSIPDLLEPRPSDPLGSASPPSQSKRAR